MFLSKLKLTHTKRDYTTRRDFFVFKSNKQNRHACDGKNFVRYADQTRKLLICFRKFGKMEKF